MDTAALARQLAELDKVATPGPWGKLTVHTPCGPDGSSILGRSRNDDGKTHYESVASADLIVALRNNLPAILRALCVMAVVDDGSKRYGIGSVHHGIRKRADELLAECTGAKQ